MRRLITILLGPDENRVTPDSVSDPGECENLHAVVAVRIEPVKNLRQLGRDVQLFFCGKNQPRCTQSTVDSSREC